MRGVAVLLVLVFHSWWGVIPGGLIGVDVFFVLSGYLITTLLLDEWRRSGRISLARFYGRRALRLLPALTLMTATCSVVVLADPASQFGSATLHAIPLTAGYMANWAYAGGSDLGLLAHTWSLSVEEQFYLLWPVILIGLLLWRGPWAALLGALPLALGNGVGSELRRPLGITIVGGLILSQMLTLFTTPVVYIYMDRIQTWLQRQRAHVAPPAPAAAHSD